MVDEPQVTPSFRGEHFTQVDFSGARLRDCDLSHVKIVDSWLVDLDISGLVRNLVVNGVDVTTYVDAELDRRFPERLQLRAMATSDDHRAMWGAVEAMWAHGVERAERLPETAWRQRVDDEWSFAETLRHLVFCTDAWLSRTVLDDPLPYSSLGYPHSSYETEQAREIGIEVAAAPSYPELMRVRAERMAVVRSIVDRLTDDELERICERSPAPGYPEQPRTVRACLRVVMTEECEHYRYAMRDLAVLESGDAPIVG